MAEDLGQQVSVRPASMPTSTNFREDTWAVTLLNPGQTLNYEIIFMFLLKLNMFLSVR
jgi:hypothetical protein